MQPVKKAMLILGAPLALAAMAGGAVAFASQTDGAETAPAPSHFRSHQVGNPTPGAGGEGHDGTGCPGKGAGSAAEGSVSPAVY